MKNSRGRFIAKKGCDLVARVILRQDELDLCKDTNNVNAGLDSMLKRFKKQVQSDGILEECKRREYFLKKSLKRKEKSKRAKIARIKEMKKSLKRRVD